MPRMVQLSPEEVDLELAKVKTIQSDDECDRNLTIARGDLLLIAAVTCDHFSDPNHFLISLDPFSDQKKSR